MLSLICGRLGRQPHTRQFRAVDACQPFTQAFVRRLAIVLVELLAETLAETLATAPAFEEELAAKSTAAFRIGTRSSHCPPPGWTRITPRSQASAFAHLPPHSSAAFTAFGLPRHPFDPALPGKPLVGTEPVAVLTSVTVLQRRRLGHTVRIC